MTTHKKTGSTSAMTMDPAAAVAVNPAVEKDYWHVNYMTRPYYVEGKSFGDYEAAYRYGWESAAKAPETSFEEAEKARLAAGWPAARGDSAFAWDEIRDAVRDAWYHARRHPGS